MDISAAPVMHYGGHSKLSPQHQYHQFSVTSEPQSVVTSSPTSTSSTVSHQTSLTIPDAPRGRRYAKENDFARHRERIAALYREKRLKDVMAIMEAEHNFVATERMYKARFKEWDLHKNVTAAEVHKLMQKVDQHKKGRAVDSAGAGKTTVLDLGDELDVKRIQKYMKRKPVGLKNLRSDPKRPLDVIKALSVDTAKGRSGRSKVSIPTVKLEQQQMLPQFHMLTSSPPDLMMPWTLADGLPNTRDMSLPKDMTRLLQIIVDQDFNTAYPYACSPVPLSPASSYQWHSHNHLQSPISPMPSVTTTPPTTTTTEDLSLPDDLMLRFVLKFRLAHVMLNDGLTTQAFEMAKVCLTILSARLQQIQSPDPRAFCTVILFALSSALENAVGTQTHHLDVLHLLFQHISVVCAAQQPRTAEFARRLAQLGDRAQLVAMLKLARRMMSRVALGSGGGDGSSSSAYPAGQQHEMIDNPSLEMYSRSVDIVANSTSAPDEKLRSLRHLASEACVQNLEDGAVWLDARVALAVGDAPWAAQQQGLWSGNSLWKYSQESKTIIFLRYSEDRVEGHKAAGNWKAADVWARELAWTAEIALGYEDELTRHFREVVDALEKGKAVSPTLLGHCSGEAEGGTVVMPGSRPASVPVSCMAHSLPLPSLDTLTMPGLGPLHDSGYKQDRAASALLSSSPSWDQAQGPFQDTTLPSLWSVGGVADAGIGLYDSAF